MYVDLKVDICDVVFIEMDIELGGNYFFGMLKESVKYFCFFVKIIFFIIF